jgi:hypothetical protein
LDLGSHPDRTPIRVLQSALAENGGIAIQDQHLFSMHDARNGNERSLELLSSQTIFDVMASCGALDSAKLELLVQVDCFKDAFFQRLVGGTLDGYFNGELIIPRC